MSYQPPYTITPKITHLVAQISEAIGGYYAPVSYTHLDDETKHPVFTARQATGFAATRRPDPRADQTGRDGDPVRQLCRCV